MGIVSLLVIFQMNLDVKLYKAGIIFTKNIVAQNYNEAKLKALKDYPNSRVIAINGDWSNIVSKSQ